MTSAAFLLGVSSHAAAFAVLVLQACLGARAIRVVGLGTGLSTRERLLFGWAAGFAITTTLWMALAAAGVLSATPVALGAAATAVLAWPEARLLATKSLAVLRTLDSGTRLALAIGLVALALWAWPLWVESLLPNSDWDSALYHLPLADRLRQGLLFGHDPYFPAFSFPGAVHLLYAALLALGLECAIAPLNLQAAVLCGLATLALARHIGNRLAPVWAAVAFATTPILWQLGLDARIDGFLALGVLLAVYGLVRFTQTGGDRYLVFAALGLGGAIGCKYTAWVFVLPVVALGLGFRIWGPKRTQELPKLLAACAFALSVPNAAWYGANLVIHADPFFPILRGDYVERDDGEQQRMPRADRPLEPERLDEPGVDARLEALEDVPRTSPPTHLFDFVDLLTDPARYAVRPHHAMGPLLLLSIALPLALPLQPERRRGALIVWGFGWGSFALLGSQIPLLRYALPALPLLAAVTGVIVSRIPVRAVRLAIALVALALLTRDHLTELRKLEILKIPVALGGEASPWSSPAVRLEWLKQVGFNFTPPMAYVSDEIRRRVASGAIETPCRILMVGEGKGRLQPCEFLPDASWFGHRFVAALENADDDTDRLAAVLASEGVTHLLYNEAYYDWVVGETDTDPARVAWLQARLDRFLADHARLVFEAGGIRLYSLDGPDGPDGPRRPGATGGEGP